MPGLFLLSLPVFLHGKNVRIPARLRYRVVEGKLVWIYELYKWEGAIRDRVAGDFLVAIKQTGLPGFEGSPEA